MQTSHSGFSEFGLRSSLLRGLTELGFQRPSWIQKEVIPAGRKGSDLLVESRSGTGKTCTFCLLILSNIILPQQDLRSIPEEESLHNIQLWLPQALVVAPTHEIVYQIQHTLSRMGKYMYGLSIRTCLGGSHSEAGAGKGSKSLKPGARKPTVAGARKSLGEEADPDPDTVILPPRDGDESEEDFQSRRAHWEKRILPQIVVGTPGRLYDLVRSQRLPLAGIKMFVCDEADRLFSSQKFQVQLDYILSQLPLVRQNMLFTVTFPPKEELRERVIQACLREPILLRLGMHDDAELDRPVVTGPFPVTQVMDSVTSAPVQGENYGGPSLQSVLQFSLRSSESSLGLPPSDDDSLWKKLKGVESESETQVLVNKLDLLVRLLSHVRFRQAIVFCNNHDYCRHVLLPTLNRLGWPCAYLSGALKPEERQRLIQKTHSGGIRVLVCSDVLARGLDFAQIGLVVNFDLPWDTATYLHRVGRTGRFGGVGLCVNLLGTERWSPEEDAEKQLEMQRKEAVRAAELAAEATKQLATQRRRKIKSRRPRSEKRLALRQKLQNRAASLTQPLTEEEVRASLVEQGEAVGSDSEEAPEPSSPHAASIPELIQEQNSERGEGDEKAQTKPTPGEGQVRLTQAERLGKIWRTARDPDQAVLSFFMEQLRGDCQATSLTEIEHQTAFPNSHQVESLIPDEVKPSQGIWDPELWSEVLEQREAVLRGGLAGEDDGEDRMVDDQKSGEGDGASDFIVRHPKRMVWTDHPQVAAAVLKLLRAELDPPIPAPKPKSALQKKPPHKRPGSRGGRSKQRKNQKRRKTQSQADRRSSRSKPQKKKDVLLGSESDRRHALPEEEVLRRLRQFMDQQRQPSDSPREAWIYSEIVEPHAPKQSTDGGILWAPKAGEWVFATWPQGTEIESDVFHTSAESLSRDLHERKEMCVQSAENNDVWYLARVEEILAQPSPPAAAKEETEEEGEERQLQIVDGIVTSLAPTRKQHRAKAVDGKVYRVSYFGHGDSELEELLLQQLRPLRLAAPVSEPQHPGGQTVQKPPSSGVIPGTTLLACWIEEEEEEEGTGDGTMGFGWSTPAAGTVCQGLVLRVADLGSSVDTDERFMYECYFPDFHHTGWIEETDIIWVGPLNALPPHLQQLTHLPGPSPPSRIPKSDEPENLLNPAFFAGDFESEGSDEGDGGDGDSEENEQEVDAAAVVMMVDDDSFEASSLQAYPPHDPMGLSAVHEANTEALAQIMFDPLQMFEFHIQSLGMMDPNSKNAETAPDSASLTS